MEPAPAAGSAATALPLTGSAELSDAELKLWASLSVGPRAQQVPVAELRASYATAKQWFERSFPLVALVPSELPYMPADWPSLQWAAAGEPSRLPALQALAPPEQQAALEELFQRHFQAACVRRLRQGKRAAEETAAAAAKRAAPSGPSSALPLDQLPRHVFEGICGLLDTGAVLLCSAVCKQLRQHAYQLPTAFWQRRFDPPAPAAPAAPTARPGPAAPPLAYLQQRARGRCDAELAQVRQRKETARHRLKRSVASNSERLCENEAAYERLDSAVGQLKADQRVLRRSDYLVVLKSKTKPPDS